MQLLVINCGSATLKWKLFRFTEGLQQVVASGAGSVRENGCAEAVMAAVAALPGRPDAIVHRVVHGGEVAKDVLLIDQAEYDRLRGLTSLAPLHNTAALQAVEATWDLGVPLLAAFDSAFHRTLPELAHRYAIAPIPAVRRYGFHGWSHRYVTERYAQLAGNDSPTIITLHLGNGCSAAAIRKGQAVDTSMGFSPLEGLVMGSRPGDLDPGVVLHLLRLGMTLEEVERLLNHDSGLMALAGTNDMKELLSRSDSAARFAVELFCYRVRKYVGAYLAVLEGAEAVIFTGGIGERSPEVRRRICAPLTWAGLQLDAERNQRGDELISADGSSLAAYAIPTDEECIIAREAARVLMAAFWFNRG